MLTYHDLAAATRAVMTTRLDRRPIDMSYLQRHVEQAHSYVRSMRFSALHTLFARVATSLAAVVQVARSAINPAAASGDQATSRIFTEVSRGLGAQLGF